jgi:hypothetical protein
MTYFHESLLHKCDRLVNPIPTHMQNRGIILLLAFWNVTINFLPTWDACVRHKKITPAQDGLHDKAVHIMSLTRQNTLSIVHSVLSWSLICQLSYFTRKYRSTVSAWSSVHVCAPHNFCEKWYTHTHNPTVNGTHYLYMFNLSIYLFN